MKSYVVLLCMVCALLFPTIGHTFQPGDIYLRFLEGDVQVKTEDTAEWLPASINMPLIDGDQIWAPHNARAELMLKDGTVVRLDRNSYLEILTSEETLAQFYLATGRAYGNTRLRKGNTIVFETPTTSFSVYGQSAFGIDISANEDSTVSVFQGEVYADRGTGQIKINAGDTMAFYRNTEYPQLARITSVDQWEQWNRRRDLEFGLPSLIPATAYLPDELGAYSSDFERNGKWVYDQEYGYVWTPTVITAKDWSPYRVGRWVWMHGDYVWISYESWGWAPYHYGRWAFINSKGWCWVPPVRGDVYWGPGFVGWVYTPTYISWVPLAPREIYYGHGNYGPHSTNIRNVNIDAATINNVVYRNIRVNNAVTTVHHDTFVTGRSIKGATKENLFLREKRVMGAPDIRPERSSFLPIMKQIPQENRPPQQIVNRVADVSNKNIRSDQIRTQGSLPSGTTGIITRNGQANERKIEVPQSPKSTSVKVEQVPLVKNPNVATGPQESNGEQAARRLGELKNNTTPQNNIKKTPPQQPAPIRSTIVPDKTVEAPERKIEVQEKTPQIPAYEKSPKANIIVPQIPKPSENVKSIPSLRSNNPTISTQAQPPKNEEKLVVRDMKPYEPREVRTPAKLNNEKENTTPQNTVREITPQQTLPVHPAIVLERKIEVQRKVPEVPAIEQRVRTEVRQKENPKPIVNVKITPPVRSNVQTIIPQPQTSPQPQNTEKMRSTPKEEQVSQQKTTIENIRSPLNVNEPKREARTEMQQRGR
jgi:hypothetical protein